MRTRAILISIIFTIFILCMAYTAMARTAGPDYGYHLFNDSTDDGGPAYQWIDATGGDSILSGAEDESQSVSMPFPFNFYGVNYSSLNVSSNGLLSFGAPNDHYDNNINSPVGNSPDNHNFIAPFWDDLSIYSKYPNGTTVTTGHAVYYDTIGSAPNRILVIEWHNVTIYPGLYYGIPIDGITFEVLLFENSSEIVFQYQDAGVFVYDYKNGADATVGIEGPTGNGLQYSYNTESLSNGLAIRYYFDYPPQTVSTIIATDYMGYGWYNESVTIVLSATDDRSGVNTTYYSNSFGPWTTYTGPITINNPSYHYVRFYSTDLAGNIESAKGRYFKMDNIKPTTTCWSLEGVVGTDGYFLSDIRVTLLAIDDIQYKEPLSNILCTMYGFGDGNFSPYLGPFNITDDTVRDLYFFSIDRAGNYEQMNHIAINMDVTAPYVVSTSPQNGIQSVNRNSNIDIVFSEPMNLSSLNSSTVKLYDWYGLEVPCALTYSGSTLTLNPDKDLGPDFQYHVVVSRDVKDAHGISMASEYAFGFKAIGVPLIPGTFVPEEVKAPTPTPEVMPTATPAPTLTPAPTTTPMATPTLTPTPTPASHPAGDNMPLYASILIVVISIVAIAGTAIYFLVFRKQ